MNRKKAQWFLALFMVAAIAFSLNSCEKDEVDIPTLTTAEITQITSAGASSGGTITDNGGAAVTARGVVWSTSQNPTIEDNKTNDGAGVGNFTSNITGLEANTTYYVRAYATNEAGTAYGQQREFTTELGADAPAVTTAVVTDIDRQRAVGGGEVTSDGGADVIARGVVWATTQNPTVDDNKTEDGDGLGEFVSEITGLEANTTYYVRAYATNEAGTGYGNEVEFTTVPEGVMIDAQGNEYQTVVIGDQEWMAENLRITIFNNGDPIPGPRRGADWAESTENETPAWASFELGRPGTDGLETDEQVIEAYGLLYNWHVANDERGVCPPGWAIPDTTDFDTLRDFIIAEFDDVTLENAGNALKAARQIDHPWGGEHATEVHPRWRLNADHYGMDKVGFNAHAAGTLGSATGTSSWIAGIAYWWTSNIYIDEDGEPTTSAYFRRIRFNAGDFQAAAFAQGAGCSIICIKVD